MYNAKARLEAEIATVKELLAEAIEIDDLLGINSYTSRLEILHKEYNTIDLSEEEETQEITVTGLPSWHWHRYDKN